MALSDLKVQQLVEACLGNWAQLNSTLRALDEPAVAQLLAWELGHRRNRSIALRLHQRLAQLRTKRERGLVAHLLETPLLRPGAEEALLREQGIITHAP